MFKLRNGQELSGVLVDPMNSHETGKSRTIYTFIPTRNMVAWKKAEMDNNTKLMRSLEGEINIEDIVWAERLNY
ncbi:MAG: hypothetical protein K0S32_2487 [Bacteroidetes bacterium]|nr:hypothetical protein [Bacteroidota bacterium]